MILSVVTCAAAQATGAWTKAEALKPVGSGTQADPYVIATAQNLLWLSVNVATEGKDGKYYVQVADIDLGGREWIPIGFSSAAFRGYYDGQGHTITGLKVDWGYYARRPDGNNNKSSDFVFGLFGWLAGSVENLVIDGAELYRSPAPTTDPNKTVDLKLGVLAGAIGSSRDIDIKNIIVRNSRIHNAGNGNDYLASGYMVGGLVGDIHGNGYDATTTSTYKYNIGSIYADVDISLPDLTLEPEREWGNKGVQYYAGGLVGRYRSMRTADQIVKNAIYTGTINAPGAMVGPAFAAARNSTGAVGSFVGFQNTYAGDFADNASGATTHADRFATTYYTDFNAYDYSNGTPAAATAVTDAVPANNNTLGTRTFKAQDSFSPSDANRPTVEQMAMFQGVNRGTYLPSTELKTKAETEVGPQEGESHWDFANNKFVVGEFRWDFANNKRDMKRRNPVNFSISKNDTYANTATYTTSRTATTGYTVKWYDVTSASSSKSPIVIANIPTQDGESVLKYLGMTSGAKKFMAVLYDGNLPLECAEIESSEYAEDVTLQEENGKITPVFTINGNQRTIDQSDAGLIFAWRVEYNNGTTETFNTNTISGLPKYDAKVYFTVTDCLGNTKNTQLEINYPITFSAEKTGQYTYTATYSTTRLPVNEYTIKWYSSDKSSPSKNRVLLDKAVNRQNESELKFLPADANRVLTAVLCDGDTEVESAQIEISEYAEIAIASDMLAQGVTYTVNLVLHDGPNTELLDPANFDMSHKIMKGNTDVTDIAPVLKEVNGMDIVYVIRDHAMVSRQFTVIASGKGNLHFSAERGQNIPTTWNRGIVAESGLRNYHITYKWHDKDYLEDALSDNLTYTYTIKNTEIVDQPLTVVNSRFSIKDLYFTTQVFKLTVYDAYGGSWSDFSEINLNPVTAVDIRVEDGALIPVYTLGNKQYAADKDEAHLTYEWKVEYSDGTTDTFDTNTLGNLRFCGADVTLTVTDRLGAQHTTNYSYSIDNFRVEVSLEGDKYIARGIVPGGLSLDVSQGTWQWYGVNGEITGNISDYYILTGKTDNELMIDRTNENYSAYCAVFTIGGKQYVGYGAKKDIVYVYNKEHTKWYIDNHASDPMYNDIYATYPDGDDLAHDGRTPRTAVRTMARAYQLLSETNRAEDNVIVVMGRLHDADYLTMPTSTYLPKEEYRRNATITGTYGEITTTGNLQLGNQSPQGINGATIFKDITLSGKLVTKDAETGVITAADKELLLYCNLNDLTLSTGVKMENFGVYSANKNGLGDYNAPGITIVGGMHHHANASLDYPPGNAEKGATTIIMQSGCVGRIIASARNNGIKAESHNVFGHPDWPHRVNVYVAIKHSTNDGTSDHEYYPTVKYKYDIGLLVGGQTDGSVFVDSRINMISGTVGRYISGNISFGRQMDEGFPDDGFWGSTVLTMEGGTIGELVGGTLGRYDTTNGQVADLGQSQAYFYGRSIININGGTIGSVGTNDGNIYGGGAGGVVGLGNDDAHTNDPTIPYYTGVMLPLPGSATGETYHQIAYGDYEAAKGKMPVMRLRHEDPNLEPDAFGRHVILDLSKSYCEVNINGGTINGNVYGGAYGYSKQVKVQNALDQAGDVFGDCRVNVRGGTITGSVFGGGAGSGQYDKDKDKYNTGKADADKITLDFTRLARVYGNTSVNIMGGIIEGGVYGGSEGIADYPDMATITGNTSVVISNRTLSDNTVRIPLINNNIFGGSKLGRINGDTSVEITGGAIGNCIFGGSEGIDDTHANTTLAIVDGSTSIRISGGSYFTAANSNSISAKNRLKPEDRTFNIYGGGYNNCIVTGNTDVRITKSLMASHLCLLEGKTFMECFNDATYRKFSVYGAGRGILTDVVGNANLTIDIEGDQTAPPTPPVDVAGNQQFFMISGGGYAGNVYGNTSVTLKGNVFARRVYGGGMYGRIEGRAGMTILGGSYDGVYGGGLLGDIMKGATLTIGNRGTSAAVAAANRNLYIYNNVYGGNDVGGIVGYVRSDLLWTDTDNDTHYPVRIYEKDETTGEERVVEYDYTLHESTEDYGVDMRIYGGHILGDVYGAGNGNHTGYYVPNYATSTNLGPWIRMQYAEGPAYLYRVNTSDPNTKTKPLFRHDENKHEYGLYLYRPRVSRVRMHIGGNTTGDRVTIDGSVYGGGHACTIGAFDPTRDVLTDPGRFIGGGTLKVNFGSHVTVGNAVYMGSRGEIVGTQTVIADTDQGHLDPVYDYHYYNPNSGVYELGFPDNRMGRNCFHAYIKLIDMEATAQLTFYNTPAAEPVYNPAEFNSGDLRWGAFFAGGARGSMTYDNGDPDKPCYEYYLPKGLTVRTHVVGGSEDAKVVFYRYAPDFRSFDTTQPIFTYQGGLVFDTNKPDKIEDAEGNPLDPSDSDYSYGHYGGGVVHWHTAPAGTDEREIQVGDETPRGSSVVIRMEVHCSFDPIKVDRANNVDWNTYKDLPDHDGEVEYDEADDIYYGGIVFGGCYNSGITNGSVQVLCSDNLLGDHFESTDFRDYLRWSTLRRNVGRVYGGGYGDAAEVWGNTFVRINDAFRGFNVFGGGLRGFVTGGTNIEVSGLAKVYNAVYGGGMRADVGKETYDPTIDGDLYASGTHIRLISGGIDRVYGGAFMGSVYGGTHILASDEDQPEGTPRLLVGHVYGGNDVSGTVYPDPDTDLCTDIEVAEAPRADKRTYTLSHKAEGSETLYYGGYPLIGNIYGAGNGNMGDYIAGVTIDRNAHTYKEGKIHIANGNGADYRVWNLGARTQNGVTEPVPLPDLATTKVVIRGGTIINVYGGGNMCTPTVSDHIIVNYADTVARAAVPTVQQDPLTWGTLRMFEDLQKAEVTTEIGKDMRFSYQIYRVFGGNNHMDMAIQPGWSLVRGQVFSVYSGGNFGRMTYPEGLTLTLDSPHMNIATVYGGGRVGDIDALDASGNRIEFGDGRYGATLNVRAGIIGDVYGGNNVAGTVYNGTNVNITGAVSGNVYGSGNGNYIYLYDHDGTRGDPYNPGQISESYDEHYGGRYFVLPPKVAYDDTYYGNSDEEKILAINSYRPNVEKAYLNIAGTETSPVFVLGNVYCGGNSSTVLFDPNLPEGGDIRFAIGDYVTLGGVFLGSNGEGLANPFNIAYLTNLNDMGEMKADNLIATRAGFEESHKAALHYNDRAAYDTDLYPNLLSLYMRAAEVSALPTQFTMPETAEHACIGNFTLGGNRGSMVTDRTIELTIPESVTIFGRIVGGCYDARIDYEGATAMGGMVKQLKPGLTDKVNLTIKSRFRPWRMVYDKDTHTVGLVNDREDADGNYVPDDKAKSGETYYYKEGRCNIFGGCFSSGLTVGDIKIDLYSDMLGRYEHSGFDPVGHTGLANTVDRDIMMANVAKRRTVYALVGAGYGPQTEVTGDIRLRLMPQRSTDDTTLHPSVCTVFGGAHDGKHIGTSTTEVRDGMVFSSLYGGSRAAYKWGSTEIIVGYPDYYVCQRDGEYTLNRADQYSYVAQARINGADKTVTLPDHTQRTYKAVNHDGSDVVKQTVKYRKGDIVAANVYSELAETDRQYFTKVSSKPTDDEYGSKWDNIDINIGDNSAMDIVGAKFYGGGGIYGGGFAMNRGSASLSGVNTQLEYDAANNPDKSASSAAIGYGGNSTIVIGDNPANSNLANITTGADGEAIRDHISIGTGHYVETRPEVDKMGTYVLDTTGGTPRFVHQAAGEPEAGVTYYKMETDGGVYGDGRRTFVQNFRAVDINGYGYASSTPQYPKLINTFQRIDLLSLTDCCLQLQSAQDYATNAIDATPYSIARVDELRLNSTLTGDIPASVADDKVAGNMRLDVARSRNYMAFFHDVHYVGAIVSNTPMSAPYRDANGTESATDTYSGVKKQYINDYEGTDPKTSETELEFKKRNLATAPNMVGINNGYTLKVQNVFTTDSSPGSGITDNVATDNIYYGPIIGVVEVKLLTSAHDEGGGYIYAFNKHEDGPTFLEETGNFVYPATIGGVSENYIVDDCYPVGYHTSAVTALSEEAHYWYVQGHNYYFNTTLTGYTFNSDMDFYLRNTDGLILLAGIDPWKKETIRVESVHWQSHTDSDYHSALAENLNTSGTDSRDNYKLYLTIDANTNNNYDLSYEDGHYTNTGNAFVARIPNGNGDNAYGNGTGGTIQQYNGSYGTGNTPLLGIRLHDTDRDNINPGFYHDHLEDPDLVVIKIKATDVEGKENTYTINLNIVYLQGPYIDGKITVENCALPGEYIYANTGNVVMEMDNSLTVTGKRWYLYPKIKPDPSVETYSWDQTPSGRVDVSRYIMSTVGDNNRLQLPARFYQNDWKIGYCVVVNGQDFLLADPEDDSNRLTVHNYHKMSTVARAVKDMKSPGGNVTNYGVDLDLDIVAGALVYIEDDKDFEIFTKYVNYCNSFRSSIADGDKVPGFDYEVVGGVLWQIEPGGHKARVLNARVLPGYNRYGFITGYLNNNTVLGYNDDADVENRNIKHPSGAENVRFVLTNDVTASKDCMVITEFRGRLNGRGHSINFGDAYEGTNFIDVNYGEIRDVGFVSVGGSDTSGTHTSCVGDNYGDVRNSFYYNYDPSNPAALTDYSGDRYSSLIGRNCTSVSPALQGTADNCYQNTNIANADGVTGVCFRSTERFHNGMVAYNLNQEYLKARMRSKDNDLLVQETMKLPTFDTHGRFIEGDYLYDWYANGDYRFAFVRSPEHPEGLRLSENFGVPNYENYLGNERTMHITNEDLAHDNTRWFKVSEKKLVKYDVRGNIIYDENGKPEMTDEGYFPIYLYDATPERNRMAHSDFIFFGQRKSTGSDREYYPHRVTYDNRVYRATGCYGSRTDYGYYFNRRAEAFTAALTAIDFTGYLDLREDDGTRKFAEGWGYYKYDKHSGNTDTEYSTYPEEYKNSDIISLSESEGMMQLIYYPPVLDLPGGADTRYMNNVLSFDVRSNTDIDRYDRITKNLLVYTPEVGAQDGRMSEIVNERLFGKLHYTRMQNWGDVNGETPQSQIIGHHIVWNSHNTGALTPHFHAYGGLFHLVDAQNFNAPIEFYVAADAESGEVTSGRAWMLRLPQAYASRGTATDANGFNISKDAWESIALPFTCNRVVAVNSADYIQKYSRGQITHFYGSDPEFGIVHHDYWLRGLVDTRKDDYNGDDVVAAADFARPGSDAGLFRITGEGGRDEQIRGDYTYTNNWFYDSYKDMAYGENHNEYGDPVTFKGYCYLTKNAPYIVAYPGPAYYEFDLSGDFYNTMHNTAGCHNQEILYEFTVDEIDPNFPAADANVRVPVTDMYDAVRTTAVVGTDNTATEHRATFKRIHGLQITDDMYVLNDALYTVNVRGTDVQLPPGSAFINCKDFGITEILPFRTYLTVSVPAGKPGARFVAIGGGMGEADEVETPDEPQQPADELGHELQLWAQGSTLMVRSTYETDIDVYTMQGALSRRIHVLEGTNSYTGLPHGFYVAHGTKFLIK